MCLRQGSNSVSDYAIEFQTLATNSGWEGRALIDAFLHRLSETIKDELLTRDLPDELDRIITLAIRDDWRTVDAWSSLDHHQASTVGDPPPSLLPKEPRRFLPRPLLPELMMMDRSQLMKEERERRVRTRSCLYGGGGGGGGHFASNCLVKGHAH